MYLPLLDRFQGTDPVLHLLSVLCTQDELPERRDHLQQPAPLRPLARPPHSQPLPSRAAPIKPQHTAIDATSRIIRPWLCGKMGGRSASSLRGRGMAGSPHRETVVDVLGAGLGHAGIGKVHLIEDQGL